jgi:hypothetical protein
MNSEIERIVERLQIPLDHIHIYVFADERQEGWGSKFIGKAGMKGSDEQRILINAAVFNGMEIYNAGKLTLVLPDDWLWVFRVVNRDPSVLRPAINWIAEEYLIHQKIVAELLPEEKAQTSWGLNHADNFIHTEYYVDTAQRRIIPKCDFIC